MGHGGRGSSWHELRHTPLRLRIYLALVATAAVVLPFLSVGTDDTARPVWLTVAVLVLVSALNVELGRALFGGLSGTRGAPVVPRSPVRPVQPRRGHRS